VTCSAQDVTGIEIREPSTRAFGAAATLRQQLATELGLALASTDGPGRCTRRMEILGVRAGAVQRISLKARGVGRVRPDRDVLRLGCRAAG
jgi:hypothetical protein